MQTEELTGPLHQLEAMLSAIDDEGVMLVGELDGYLAGVLISPEPIAPEEWLPAIFADLLPEALPSGEDFARLNDLISARHAEIAAELAIDRYQPLYEVDDNEDESVLWEIWLAGFERAMAMRLAAWEKLLKRKQESIAQESAFLLMDLLDIGMASEPPDDAGALKLAADAPSLIPELAGNLYRAHVVASAAVPLRVESVGRNDPCPCGSGLKYKKCHGAS